MAELINRDAFRDFWNENYRHQYANDMFLIALANFPTTDAVPVVRCKDCKHCRKVVVGIVSKKIELRCGLYDDDFLPGVQKYAFCSFGERCLNEENT